jgi:hypothetical protein
LRRSKPAACRQRRNAWPRSPGDSSPTTSRRGLARIADDRRPAGSAGPGACRQGRRMRERLRRPPRYNIVETGAAVRRARAGGRRQLERDAVEPRSSGERASGAAAGNGSRSGSRRDSR